MLCQLQILYLRSSWLQNYYVILGMEDVSANGIQVTNRPSVSHAEESISAKNVLAFARCSLTRLGIGFAVQHVLKAMEDSIK